MAENKQLLGAVQAASYNIVLQILFRLQTFLLNGFILRFISKDVLGIINVRIFLLYSTVLFLSKEAFRNACLSNTKDHNWPKVINLLWLMLPTSALCSIVLGYVWTNLLEQPKEIGLSYQYTVTVWIVCLCCVLEMLAEPLYAVARIFLFNKLRVVIESLSFGLRCLALALVVYFKPNQALYGYAFGQVLCSITWVLGIYVYFAIYFNKNLARTEADKNEKNLREFPFNSLLDFLPRRLSGQTSLPQEQLSLTWSFFKQGFLKQILTEGERYVMTIFDVLSFAEQGIFDVVNNLGSMAARFIFRPVEDSSYQFFAASVKRDVPISKQNKEEIKLVANFLEHLLRAMTLLGLTIVAFGYGYSYLLLHIYGGTILSSGAGPTLLRWHCAYVFFLAVNGITECFTFATMSKRNVESYNYLMVGFSIGFLFLSWYLTNIFGSVGFILANCANMLARIIYSCRFIHNYFKSSIYKPLNGLKPDTVVLFGLLASFIITTWSQKNFCCDFGLVHILIHISTGAVCFVGVCSLVIFREKELIRFARNLVKSKKL